MTKKQLAWILGALVVAGVYFLLTSDRVNTPPLKIAYKVIPQRVAGDRGNRGAAGRGGLLSGLLTGRSANDPSTGRRGAGSRGASGTLNTPPADPLFFMFDRMLTLDWIKVYPFNDFETNRDLPHLVWEVIANTNPVPTKGFIYGMSGAPEKYGMHLAVKGFGAEPLEPGVKYRMLLSANSGAIKANYDFVAPSQTP